jgi:hypothetical protein
MGFDMHMLEPPTAAEVKKANLPDDAGTFRFNSARMPVMVLTMVLAGALADDDVAPDLPAWPPKDAPKDRKTALEQAGTDPKAETKLTPAEKKALADAKKATHDAQVTRSKHTGMVPAFKFATSDGFIVTGDEAGIIATKLRAYAAKVDAAQLAKLEKTFHDQQKPLVDAAKQRGETIPYADQPLGLTVDRFRTWVAGWVAYNEVASHHGGYRVD